MFLSTVLVLHVSTSIFFIDNDILLYEYVTLFMFNQAVDIWVASASWLLWIMLLILYKLLCAHTFHKFCNKQLKGKLPNLMVALYIYFEELPNCFTKWLYHFTFLLASMTSTFFLYPHQHSYCAFFFFFFFLLTDILIVWTGTTLWFWFAFLWWLITSSIFFSPFLLCW
jgi:hypothetical protein